MSGTIAERAQGKGLIGDDALPPGAVRSSETDACIVPGICLCLSGVTPFGRPAHHAVVKMGEGGSEDRPA